MSHKGRLSIAMAQCVAAVLAGLVIPTTALRAVVIDDFTVGPVTITGSGTHTQTGLDPAHVLSGSRALSAGQYFATSNLVIDPSVGLQLSSTNWGYFTVKYDFAPLAEGIDLTAGGNDRFRLKFGNISTGFTPLSLYASLPESSSSNGISVYVKNWNGMILEFPFSKFPASMSSTTSLTLSVSRNPPGSMMQVRSITTAGTPLAGDYDRNGVVDAADYSEWRRFVGVNTKTNLIYPVASADGNGDGLVDAADYLIWRKAMSGDNAPGSLAETAVPEPSFAAMIIALLVAITIVRGRALLSQKAL